MNLRQTINETLDEFVDNVTMDSLKNDTHGMPIVYQCAFSNRLPNIFKNGMSREFAGSAGGNFYCTGLYTTFNLKSTIENIKTKASVYGDAILKMAIKSYDGFFIANKRIAQEVYGDKWRFDDQLKILFPPTEYQRIRNSGYWSEIVSTMHHRTSANVVAFCEAMGGMRRACDPKLNEFGIMGFVFNGANDGDVAIIRDFKAIIPLSYSLDQGRTWRTDLLTDETLENTARDFDPLIFLGKAVKEYVDPKSYRVINGYMKVQRKSDNKYNFINASTHKLLSPIWFENASPMNDNRRAFVKYNDNTFYVGEDGFYETEDDEYPFADFDDI